jgi:transcriptional regulator with PAS, ATPase and Fis domain
MVRQGSFREDLLFRLNVVRLEVPPLRKRDGDIRLLMEYFLNKFNRQFQKKIRGFSPEVIEILRRYPYPGNVRELANMVEYATNVCHETIIKPEHLPDYLLEPWHESLQTEDAVSADESDSYSGLADEQMKTRVADNRLNWREMERRMISEALLKSRGNRTKAAKLLGWGRSTLWRKMKQHNLV